MSPIPFTQQGLDKVQAERDKLVAERPDAVSNLTKAREMGDLSENGYYKESRARLSFIDGRLRHLERILKNAVVMPRASGDTIDFGSKVKLSSGDKQLEYTVVGSFESDPAQSTISAKSPLGNALMGKKAGDEVTITTPNGETKYKILSVSA
jgi:transcription elongation factor GreA